MGSNQTLAEEAQIQTQLFRQCQQRRLYLNALIRVRDTRNEGDAFLSSAIKTPNFQPRFTQDQLDMRRKAEILQYAGPSTQGGKRESQLKQFSRINQRFRSFKDYLNQSCESVLYNVPTLTSQSDVPGPPQFLVYDPEVTLYQFQGMRSDMRQINVPATSLPPYDFDIFDSNFSVAKYLTGSYNVFDVLFSPLNIAAVTYFNFSQEPKLQCYLTYQLDVTVSFTLLDPTLPDNSSMIPVDSLQLFITGMDTRVYTMTEPQLFTPDFLSLTEALNFGTSFPKLFMPRNESSQQYVYGNYSVTYNIANSSNVQFAVTGVNPDKKMQTDRLSFNVSFDLLVYDTNGADVNPALPINMTGLMLQFQLTPLSAILK
jgi:hypothetical protein